MVIIIILISKFQNLLSAMTNSMARPGLDRRLKIYFKKFDKEFNAVRKCVALYS